MNIRSFMITESIWSVTIVEIEYVCREIVYLCFGHFAMNTRSFMIVENIFVFFFSEVTSIRSLHDRGERIRV